MSVEGGASTNDEPTVKANVCFLDVSCLQYHLVDEWKDREIRNRVDKSSIAQKQDLSQRQRHFILANSITSSERLLIPAPLPRPIKEPGIFVNDFIFRVFLKTLIHLPSDVKILT